jgi:hypothetical protein
VAQMMPTEEMTSRRAIGVPLTMVKSGPEPSPSDTQNGSSGTMTAWFGQIPKLMVQGPGGCLPGPDAGHSPVRCGRSRTAAEYSNDPRQQ